MAQPELSHDAVSNGCQPLDLRVVLGYACTQPIHHGRSLSEQKQHDHQDQEQVAQESGDAAQDYSNGIGQSARFHHLLQIDVRKPKTL
jgi:hypothetical protein